jgi:hypothetical protein
MRAHQDKPGEGKFSGVGTILLAMAAIALAGMVGTIGLIRQVGDIGPTVGDIVAFDPLDSMSRDMKASVTAVRTGSQHGVACILDVRAMHAGGGSLVIESRQPATTNGLRVHWAGARTADDATSCGSSAELLLNQDDIEVLAMAAGGFGVPSARGFHLWSAGSKDVVQ